MITPQFEAYYRKLNPEQKEAVDLIEGPVMVVAGPGTGKTQILTLRIANILLKTQINPENILALTFSDSAARQMRSRLVEVIGTPAYRVEITTFHSFANSLIRNYPEEFGDLLSATSISDVEQIEIIESVLQENDFDLIKPLGDPLYYVKKIIDSINELKKEGVLPEKFEQVLEESFKNWESIPDLYHDKGRFKGQMKGKYSDMKKDLEKDRELLKAYKLYQQKLKEEKKYDFNDMLIEAIKVLEKNNRLLLLLQERYQYFLVDEHQDTNSSQNRLVELLASFYESPNLFVVGDEKQAIFRFQGASLENFFYFKKLYPGAKIINLTRNYRSQQTILDASHSVIEKNISANIIFETVIRLEGLKEKPITRVKIIQAETFFEEFQIIAEDIKSKIENGVKPSEIAVLGRNNKDLLEAREIFKRNSIPSSLISDTDLLNEPANQKMIMLLQAINDPSDEASFIKAMHLNSLGIDPFDIYKILNSARKEKKSFLSKAGSLKDADEQELDLESFEGIKKFIKNFKLWRKIAVNEGPEKVFVAVFEDSGLKKEILASLGDYEAFSKVNSLFELLKEKVYENPKYSLEDFIKFLDITKSHNLPVKSKTQVFGSDTVKLMTAHKSKGLEFDYVYIVQAYDGHWGNKRQIAAGFKIPWDQIGTKVTVSEDQNEDERRLFYVAMTRARLGVYISYSRLSLEGKEQLPSQFISEIKPELIEDAGLSAAKKIEEIILTNFISEPISAKNALVIKTLFGARGLSVTALSNFLECPWKWFYRNLLLMPDSKTPVLVYGSAIHSSLNRYLGALEAGKADYGVLIKTLAEYLENETLSDSDKKRLTRQGEKALLAFYENVCRHWKKGLIGEFSVNGVRISDGLILNGRIDMIEDLGKGSVVVHDFKTGKSKSRRQIDGSNPNSKSNYFRQLVFYKLLLDNYKGGVWSVKSGVIDFVEPDEKGRIRSEIFEIGDSEVDLLKQEVVSVGKQINDLAFWDLNCGVKDCEWCALRQLIN